MKNITKMLLSLFTLGVSYAAFAETLTIEGDLVIDNTPEDPGDKSIVRTHAGALTVLGGHVAQDGSVNRSGAIFRIGSMTSGATQYDTDGTYFKWFTSIQFSDSDQKVAYIYLGEFPFQMWGYFDVTVSSDYLGPSKVGRGAITKRFPLAYNASSSPSPGELHNPSAESAAVIAAVGGIVDHATIGEVEVHGTQLRVPVYYKAGLHSLGAISVEGMFTRAYNEEGYPYVEVESYTDPIELNNAVTIRDLNIEGTITLDTAQGDISMGAFGSGL